jgi:chitinase
MSSSAGNRAKFINGLKSFMDQYAFDGVDLDWEYPQADDRGGSDGDKANYVSLVKEMRAAFGSKYGITVTLPTSYWYLQHFDLVGLQSNVDWFNLMSYDCTFLGLTCASYDSEPIKLGCASVFSANTKYQLVHGVWDAQSKFVGPFIAPHTNITEIDLGMDLLWRAGVDSNKVVLGQGWVRTSFPRPSLYELMQASVRT